MPVPLKILILEDSEEDALLVLQELEMGGYDVSYHLVETAKGFHLALDHQEWDLVIADYMVPGLSGMEALKLIKERGLDLPLILMSGTIGEEEAVAILKAGAHDFIIKGHWSRLVPAVQRELKESEIRRERYRALAALQIERQRLARLNDCFLSFVPNADENIQRLVEVGGELLQGTCAFYNLLQGDRLFSLGRWNTPPDYQDLDLACGQICFDLICQSTKKPLVLRDLQSSHYAKSDPHITKYGLQTYIGTTVYCRQVAVGSFCIVYQKDLNPDHTDLYFLNIIANAIGVEEERKRAQEEVQRLRRQRESILNSTGEGIIALDLTGKQTFINPVAARMLGYEVGELIGRPSHDIWHRPKAEGTQLPEDACPIYPALLKGETYHCRDEVFWRKDGTSFTVECYCVPIYENGELTGGVVTFKDVYELNEAEELARNLITISPVGIYILQDNKFQIVNHWFRTITGYGEEELSSFNPSQLVDPADRDKVQLNSLRMLRGESCPPYEYRAITATGETRWIMETVAPIRYRGKGAVLGHFMDITERKELERQFLQAQKMEAVGRLAGGVAHDFNNMMAVIQWYADSIMEHLKPKDPLYKYAEAIKQAGGRAISLTRQLLAFSRKQIMKPQLLNLNNLVNDIENMLRRLIGENIDLGAILVPGLGAIKADPAQIEQVIMDLALNARDAMPQGGRLTIETGNVYLDAAYAQKHAEVVAGNYVMLAVCDNGMGMDQETLSRIFEPFSTNEEDRKGTGLGLAAVYGIVKQSGGHIRVYSEPGQGTTFKVYFPEVKGKVKSLKERKSPAKPLQGLETIIVVEDEDMLRELLCDTLRMHRYTVLAASDGAEALRISEKHKDPIHLLLTDMVLPMLGGRELAERLSPVHPETKVIYMSGYTEKAIVQQEVLGSDKNFISKPFNATELLEKLREVLPSTPEV